MELHGTIGNTAIQEVLTQYPEIGPLLERFGIGCVTCKVGICLLKDVVAIHGLPKEDEAKIEEEINGILRKYSEKSVVSSQKAEGGNLGDPHFIYNLNP